MGTGGKARTTHLHLVTKSRISTVDAIFLLPLGVCMTVAGQFLILQEDKFIFPCHPLTADGQHLCAFINTNNMFTSSNSRKFYFICKIFVMPASLHEIHSDPILPSTPSSSEWPLSFFLACSPKPCTLFCPLRCVPHVPPSYLTLIRSANDIWGWVQFMKLLIDAQHNQYLLYVFLTPNNP
jgi:hypothetical protein